MWKKIPVLLTLFFCFFGTAHAESGTPTVIIINQVRGRECCDVGSGEALRSQIAEVQKLQLPALFALRFDALKDPALTDLFRNQPTIETGVMLEITPGLAREAGVNYRGEESHWYKAGYAYLVGYSQDERKKLIDTVMDQYKNVFGTFPKTTVAWMIDPWSLSYLSKTFGVIAHEITREQFSLDSYTLYGGPHLPYIPSKNFALVPDSSEKEMPLIMRQTVTDPLFTYGDTSSTFTSQANDYRNGRRDLSYFDALVSSALFSSRPFGFALIGLENSMAEQYQQEYLEQLALIAKWKKDGKVVVRTARDATTFLRSSVSDTPQITTRSDGDNTAYWIGTDHYRMRLIKKGNDVMITDLRIYDKRLEDPYLSNPSQLANAYWIIPALIDGSRTFTNPTVKNKTVLQLSNDFESSPDGLVLPDSNQKITIGDASLSYDALHMQFEDETITFVFSNERDASQCMEQIRGRTVNTLLSFGAEQKGKTVTLQPRITDSTAGSSLPEKLVPVQVSSQIDASKTILHYSNRSAIVGKNPLRLVLRLRDGNGQPVIPGLSAISLHPSDTTVQTKIAVGDETDGQYYVDFESSTASDFSATISIGEVNLTTDTLRFVPDCPHQKSSCLKHPTQLFWYLYTKVVDRMRAK